MDATDRARLTANGYHIYRVDENRLTITEYTEAGGWKLHSRHKTKVALRTAWGHLHYNPLSIGD